MPSNQFTNLQTQIWRDLTSRACCGICLYLPTWLIIAYCADIQIKTPQFFLANTFLLTITAGLRFFYYQHCKALGYKQAALEHKILVGLILFNALHWGIMSSWLIYNDHYQQFTYPIIIVMITFAIGGAAVFNIFRVLGVLYPILVLAPCLIAGFFYDKEHYTLLVSLTTLLMGYVLYICKSANHEYISSMQKQLQATDRANQLEQLSTIDYLTKLHNRLYFTQKIKEAWLSNIRSEQPISLLYLDLDHFKKLNDQFGHMAGDACLEQVGATIQSEIKRATDTAARYGGEEFTIILPDTDLAAATVVANRLLKAIRYMQFEWKEQRISVTCSIGIASMVPDRKTEHSSLIEMADKALYQAKQAGRDQCVTYQPDNQNDQTFSGQPHPATDY